MELVTGFQHPRKRLASSCLLEVGPFDLHGDRASSPPRLFAPIPNVIRHVEDAGFDTRGLDQILVEGGLRTARLALPAWVDHPMVLAARDAVIPGSRPTEVGLQVLKGPGLQVGAGVDAKVVHLPGSRRTDPVELGYRQNLDERLAVMRLDSELSVGLALPRGKLS